MKRDWNFLHIMALIFLVIGFGILLKNLFMLNTGIHTEGTVVNIIKRKSTGFKPATTYTYHPEVTFKLENGASQTVSISDQSTNRRMSYHVGDKIKLIYPKDDYKKVQINSFSWIYGFPGIMILVGTIGWFLAGFDFND